MKNNRCKQNKNEKTHVKSFLSFKVGLDALRSKLPGSQLIQSCMLLIYPYRYRYIYITHRHTVCAHAIYIHYTKCPNFCYINMKLRKEMRSHHSFILFVFIFLILILIYDYVKWLFLSTEIWSMMILRKLKCHEKKKKKTHTFLNLIILIFNAIDFFKKKKENGWQHLAFTQSDMAYNDLMLAIATLSPVGNGHTYCICKTSSNKC